jgi:hypothetical protein
MTVMAEAGPLDPADPALRGLLWTVAELGGGDLAGDVGAIAGGLGDREVRVVFGGHFSCGKSSLLNALIGRAVLPTGDFPETGVPCVLVAGESDGLQVVTAGGETRDLPFGTESIARRVRLVDERGDYRPAVHDSSRLVIRLAGGGPDAGVSWIDSPGINDTEAMTDRARAVAGDADLLVWVVNSRQPFAESEQSFVADHVATHGPASLAFVVNAFLAADDAAAWERFLAERLAILRGRIENAGITDPLPARVVAVSARATAGDPGGFGLPALRELLASVAGAPEIPATRLSRAVTRLRSLADRVGARADRERREVERQAGALRELNASGEGRRREFGRQVEPAIAAQFAGYAYAVQGHAATIAAALTTQPLRRDSTYGDWLTAAMTDLGARLAAAVVAHADWHAYAHGLSTMRPDAVARLGELLRPAPIAVAVPSTPVPKHLSAGAVIGGIVGTMVFPGVGTAVGAGLGAAAGSLTDPAGRALQKDREGALANLVAAAQRAAADLEAKRGAVLQLVLDPAATPLVTPDPPDEGPVRALEALHRHLAETLVPAVAAARDGALARVTA